MIASPAVLFCNHMLVSRIGKVSLASSYEFLRGLSFRGGPLGLAVTPIRAAGIGMSGDRPPILRSKARDHGQIEALTCGALTYGNDRPKRGVSGAVAHPGNQGTPAVDLLVARQDSNLQPDRYEREDIDRAR
jgi:hypothetical protein